jgi:hypothetical protein
MEVVVDVHQQRGRTSIKIANSGHMPDTTDTFALLVKI